MLDVVKISVKTALITGSIIAFVVVIALIPVPSVDMSVITERINNVYSIAVHWCPIFANLYGLALTIIGVNIALLVFRAGLFAFKALMTIFE